MRRMERRRADREKRAPRTLFETDYLLLVDDQARAGALRFKAEEGGPFLKESDAGSVPPLVELPKLLSAQRVIDCYWRRALPWVAPVRRRRCGKKTAG
jgi:serine/threonine-protein kinase HipA